MTGTDKFKAIGQKLKAEVAQEEEVKEEQKAVAINQLQALKDNEQLAQMYQESAQIGASNLAGELPLLKVHAVGKSMKNELANGQEPTDGYFFYKPTGEQYQEIVVHILTISKGFRAEGMEQKGGEKKMVFNQIVGGVIVENGDYKPFIMYFTGLKLSNLWEFGKEVSKYTHAKPVAIPMFALKVKLTTEKKENNFGKSWVINFEFIRTEDGTPQLVLDPGEFQFLKDNAEMLGETIESLIQAKSAKEESIENLTDLPSEDRFVEDTVDPNKIPF